MKKATSATLKLFNSILSSDKYILTPTPSPKLIREALEHGLYFDASVLTRENLDAAIKVYGLTERQANQTLHKSWDKIKTATDLELAVDQILHYITTYGFEALGIYQENWVYIPDETYEYSGTDWKLRYIRAETPYDIKQKVVALVSSGIALKEETVNHLFTIIAGNPEYYKGVVDHVANRELMTKLCDTFNIVPRDPEKWLRYVVYKVTGETLLIKSKDLLTKIKLSGEGKALDALLEDAPLHSSLGSIFNRYKEIFLALKSISSNKTFFNKVSKWSKMSHKPLPEDYLNSVTANIQDVNLLDLENRLKHASIWRKIRLAYALQYRVNADFFPVNVYLVRNGKSYVDLDFKVNRVDKVKYADTLGVVLESIADTLAKKVSGKTVFIPDYIDYALPATEKQFFGNLPAGTSVGLYNDSGIGIHWFNHISGTRVDLDFAALSVTGKYGWDGSWRNTSLLFSGDVTTAPKPDGAAEIFQVKGRSSDSLLFSLNYYNQSDHAPAEQIEVDLFVADEVNVQASRLVASENVLIREKFVLPGQQSIVGALVDNRFYFMAPFVQGKGRSIKNSKYVNGINQWLVAKASSRISLELLLYMSGARVVHNRPDWDIDYIDLVPEQLTKNSIIGLFSE